MSTVLLVARRTLRDQRRAPLWWGGALGAMCALMVAIWPSIKDSLARAVETYPEGLRETFRVDDLDTVAAYLDTEMFSLIVPLAVGVLGARCVTRAIAAAEDRRHLDVLLSAPLGRGTLVAGVLLATAATLAAVLALTAALAWLASVAAGAGLGLGEALAGVASVWPVGMFCAGLAAAAGGALHGSGHVTAIAVGTLVGMYVLDLVGRLSDGLDWARWGSVFRFYGSALRDGLDVPAFTGVAVVGLLLAAAGALLLGRRDIHA